MSDLALALKRMLNKPLYVALRRAKDPTRINSVLPRHIEWVLGAEQRGEIFLSGPFVGASQPGELGGMSIVRAASVDAASAVINADPFISEGVFDVEIMPWMLMEGSLTFNLTLSDQKTRVY